jgi:hypothetical protein
MSSSSPSAPRRPAGLRWRGAESEADPATRRLEREADACMTGQEQEEYIGYLPVAQQNAAHKPVEALP